MGEKCAVARNIGLVVPLLGIMLELLLGRCPAARYVRLPGCPEICPAARKYARLSGCPVCPAARYARLPGTMPGCPEICPAVRLPGMPGCPVCPAVRNYARLSGCPELCPAARNYARNYARLPGIGTTATSLGRPTPAFSGAAGDLHRPR